MPIAIDLLDKNFVVAAPNATIGELLRQLPEKRTQRAWFYIVQQATNGRYYVLRWHEVEEIGRAMGGELGNYSFKQLSSRAAWASRRPPAYALCSQARGWWCCRTAR